MSKTWEFLGWAALATIGFWSIALFITLLPLLDWFYFFVLLGIYWFPLFLVLYMAFGFNLRERLARIEQDEEEKEMFKRE